MTLSSRVGRCEDVRLGLGDEVEVIPNHDVVNDSLFAFGPGFFLFCSLYFLYASNLKMGMICYAFLNT